MNVHKKVSAMLATAAATLLVSSAWANNGVQNYTFDGGPGPPGFYVDCLGENIIWVWHITGSYQEFVTTSGTYHLLDNWKAWAEYTGLVTGRTWVAKVVSPFRWNAGPGETNQWVAKAIAKPLTGDGPMFVFKNRFKVTVNANGELVVDRPTDEVEDSFRCLGND